MASAKSDNQSNTHSNTCDNSYSGYSVEEKILHAIDESEIELKPYEIAHKIHAKRSTVRVICRKLLDRGLIIQPYEGAYCNKITHGMRFVPRMVHNIRLSSNLCQNVKHEVIDEKTGNVDVRVVFGEERRKVSGWIKCDAGMVYDSCMFALNRWFDVVESKLGFSVNEVTISTFEVNKDYKGFRFEGGIKCVTRSGLFGMIERFYQKESDLIRQEYKNTKPIGLTEFENLIKSNTDNLDTTQGLIETQRELADLRKASQYQAKVIVGMSKLLEAIYKGASGDGGVSSAKPLGHEGDYSR